MCVCVCPLAEDGWSCSIGLVLVCFGSRPMLFNQSPKRLPLEFFGSLAADKSPQRSTWLLIAPTFLPFPFHLTMHLSRIFACFDPPLRNGGSLSATRGMERLAVIIHLHSFFSMTLTGIVFFSWY